MPVSPNLLPFSSAVGRFASLISGHHCGNIIFDGADRLDIEIFHENIQHCRGNKGRQGRSKTDTLDAEV